MQGYSSPTAAALYRKVICRDLLVPLPDYQKRKGGNGWECCTCGRGNAVEEYRCECGYHSLALEGVRSSKEVGEVSRVLYWECECTFALNTRNVENCLKCGKKDENVAEEVRRNRKPLPELQKGLISRCLVF